MEKNEQHEERQKYKSDSKVENEEDSLDECNIERMKLTKLK